MRYLVYDEDGFLMRKFYTKQEATLFLQEGWKLMVVPKPKKKTLAEEFPDLMDPPF